MPKLFNKNWSGQKPNWHQPLPKSKLIILLVAGVILIIVIGIAIVEPEPQQTEPTPKQTEPVSQQTVIEQQTVKPTPKAEKIKPSSDKEYTDLFIPLVDEAKAVIDEAVPLLTEENPKNAPKLRDIAKRLGDTVTKMTNITPPDRFEQPHWVFIGGVDTYIQAFTLIADGWENNSQEQLTQAAQLIIEASNDIRRATEAIK